MATVYDVVIDRKFLEARLGELGGKDPALLEHDVDENGARVVTRSSIPVEFLPSVIQRFTGGDLVLDRVETWAPADGGYRGSFEVTVRRLPGRLTGTQTLSEDGDGSVTVVDGDAEVPVPFVAGRIEAIVTEQVGALLDAEDGFTRRWLADGA